MPENTLIAALLQENKNVLVMDVCSLFDALRPLDRDARDAVEMVTRMDREIQKDALPFALILPSLFAYEWNSNIAKIKGDLTKSLQTYKNQSDYIDFLCQMLYGTEMAMPDVTRYGFDVSLESTCLRIMRAAQTIEENDAAKLSAFERLKEGRAPSSRNDPENRGKNKPEFKDCVIFEEVLTMGRELRGAGFNGKIVFVSSNTSDYGKTGQPFPEIAADLQTIQAEFASKLNYAYHIAAQKQ